MARFTRVLEVGDEPPVTLIFEAASQQGAIEATLEELQTLVQEHPGMMSAAAIIGEGDGARDAVKWMGGWVWRVGKGYSWTEMD